jgi:hypothetical protein
MVPARRQIPLVLGLMSAILFGVTSAWAAGVTVSPGSLSFGSVQVGTKATKQVTVTQNGTGSTSVSVSISGSNSSSFSASPTSFTVSSSGTKSKNVTVTCSPNTTGSLSATLHVNFHNVSLSCTGIPGSSSDPGIVSYNNYYQPLLRVPLFP